MLRYIAAAAGADAVTYAARVRRSASTLRDMILR